MKNRLTICSIVLGIIALCAVAQADDNPVTQAVSTTVKTSADVVTGTADAVYKAPGQVVDATYKAPGQVVDATYKAPGQVVDAVSSVVNNFIPGNKKN